MGKVIGFETSSQDPEKAVQFYEQLFGWKFSEPNWDYWAVNEQDDRHNSGFVGGISKGPHDYPHGTRIQIEVSSLDETISKAKDLGAMIVRDKMEFDAYFLAYLVDPTGVGFGLVERK